MDGRVERRVLDGVNLTVSSGELIALTGPSGSGKTTLLTLLAGLDHPDSGSVELLGRTTIPPVMPWSELSIVPQSLGLFEELTVRENICLPLMLGSSSLDPDAMMARLGLERLGSRLPDEISLGEQQRVSLARAAVAAPALLLADEPTAHQNQSFVTAVLDVLRELTRSGSACVIATHSDVALGVADRVLTLQGGRLVPPN